MSTQAQELRKRQLIEEGYRSTGAVFHDWERDKAEARAAQLHINGNKVKILWEVEVTNFRDRQDKTWWLRIYVKYSEAHLMMLAEQQAERERLAHEIKLRRIADEITEEDALAILKMKIQQAHESKES